MNTSIEFVHLGIKFPNVGQYFTIFGIQIAYYGGIIAIAMLAGIFLAMYLAKKTGQDPDFYFNFAIMAIVLSVIGARVYYVIFSWDYYGAHPLEILNFRGGGLAIYGGIITAILTAYFYCRHYKVAPLRMMDTAIPCLILGQAIGRWGNFFNREAFGEYTDSLFAMRLPVNAVTASSITQKMQEHIVTENGVDFIQVHPTFLYESMWNFGVLAVLLFVLLKVKKRFDGEVIYLYLLGYGLGRLWIEGLRTDQLLLPGTGIAVSQVVSAILVIIAVICLVRGNRRKRSTAQA